MILGFIGTGKISSSVITGICNSKISFKKILISPRNKFLSKKLSKKFKKVKIAQNNQQIITLNESIPNIKDGGIILIEDTHTSYSKRFGNPSKYSFMNYSKYLVDVVNSRFPSEEIKKNNEFRKKIFSVLFYESMVAFKIDKRKCVDNVNLVTEAEGIDVNDLRTTDYFPKISKFQCLQFFLM